MFAIAWSAIVFGKRYTPYRNNNGCFTIEGACLCIASLFPSIWRHFLPFRLNSVISALEMYKGSLRHMEKTMHHHFEMSIISNIYHCEATSCFHSFKFCNIRPTPRTYMIDNFLTPMQKVRINTTGSKESRVWIGHIEPMAQTMHNGHKIVLIICPCISGFIFGYSSFNNMTNL